jgi:hypothetical protein
MPYSLILGRRKCRSGAGVKGSRAAFEPAEESFLPMASLLTRSAQSMGRYVIRPCSTLIENTGAATICLFPESVPSFAFEARWVGDYRHVVSPQMATVRAAEFLIYGRGIDDFRTLPTQHTTPTRPRLKLGLLLFVLQIDELEHSGGSEARRSMGRAGGRGRAAASLAAARGFSAALSRGGDAVIGIDTLTPTRLPYIGPVILAKGRSIA